MQFLDEDIYATVKNYIPKESEYVNSHGGGLEQRRDCLHQTDRCVWWMFYESYNNKDDCTKKAEPIHEEKHGIIDNIKHIVGL